MDKKRIKESLIQALFVVSTQIAYGKIFGTNNMLVGMIMGMGTVSFLARDLTGALVYRTVTFLILNILLGILSYLSTINIWIGFFINFTTIFITTYIYMNDFRSPTSYIFLMLYIFMWATPVSFNELPNRLEALSLSIIIIMLAQIIFNRNKFKKESNLIIKTIVYDIQNNIDDMQKNEYNLTNSMEINNSIKKLLTLINEKRYRGFWHSRYEINHFNVAVSLDRLNIIINQVGKYKKDKYIKNRYLEDIKIQIKNIEKINENIEDIEYINKDIDIFINKYNEIINMPEFIYDTIDLLKLFKLSINNYSEFKDEKLNKIYKTINIPSEFKLFDIIKENFRLSSLKFIYSLKLALSISISMFLVQFLNVEYGKWIVITIYVITQPYKEDTLIKAKKRFVGTFVGVILFFMIFSIINDIIPKTIVLLAAFFCYFYFNEYDKKVSSMTIISLSAVSLVENINILSINRLIFIIVGIIIGLIFNRYFFPYNISDSIDELKNKYKKNNKKMLKELDKVVKGKGDLDKLIKVALISNQLENKLIANNNRFKDKRIEVLIYKQSIITSDARFSLLKLYNND